MESSTNGKGKSTWNEVHSRVQIYRSKFAGLSTKVPENFTFRKINSETTRLYFLSVPNDGCETTLLYTDISTKVSAPENGSDTNACEDKTLRWCSLLESSFQIRHQVKQYSKEEQLLRERKRQVTWGITSYDIDLSSGRFVFPICGSLFTCVDNQSQSSYFPDELRTESSGIRLNCQICPSNPDLLSYIKGCDLWIQDTTSYDEVRLTFAHKNFKNLKDDPLSAGVPSYIMQEEFNRYIGHWWQPKSSTDGLYRILYEEVDDGEVNILHFPVSSDDGRIEEFRFPRPGTPNSKSTLKIIQFRLSDTEQAQDSCTFILQQPLEISHPWVEYIVRIGWTPDGKYVWAVLLNRLQTFSQLVLFPLKAFVPLENCTSQTFTPSVPSKVIFQEKSDKWLNIHDILHFFPETSPDEISFIWANEETGYRHLYLITAQINDSNTSKSSHHNEDIDASPIITKKIALTFGEWEVLPKNVWIDEKHQLVYFIGLSDGPLEKHLYAVSIANPCEIVRLTELGYSHCVHLDLDCSMFVSVMSNTFSMPSSHVYSIEFSEEAVPEVNSLKATHVACLLKAPSLEQRILHPEIFNYKISSGHKMYGMIYKPPNMVPNKKYPTVLVVYGGPEVQLISNSFKGLRQLRQVMLASEGYVVVSIDNRGSRYRGVEFETYLKNRLGTVEIGDQIEVLELLAKDKNFIDLSRVAIHGWSYGGYLSLMGLAQRSDFFKVAIAGAPVTSWGLYDTGYTERYIGLPSENMNAYKAGSVLSYASQFPDEENRLLILHGLIDENVHFTHTSQLINSLLKARKPYQLQVYPRERHSLRHLEASEHFETTLLNFLNQWL